MQRHHFLLTALWVVLFAMVGFLPVSAQMSDAQVKKFVQRELRAGTKQSQIVTKLMQRGVKIDQIRRIQQQAGQEGTSSATSARGQQEGVVESRLRQNNANGMEDEGRQSRTSVGMEDDLSDYPAQPSSRRDDREDVQDDGSDIFGHDIFNKKLLSFEPNMNIATPQNYVLGPGDQVFVDVYGASQKTEQLEVSPEGTITVPGYGPVAVGGLTVAAAQARLRSTLGARYASSKLSLSVGQTRTILVNVMGEVRAPGTYTLSAFATVFHALYMAGGINGLGTLRNIKVFRQGRQLTVVDVYEFILNGRLAGNVRLQDNDVIVVGPYDCLVDVYGAVKRPMTYEMRSTESVGTLIRYAGGFMGNAYRKSVSVTRSAGSRNSVYTVDEFDQSSFRVCDGDTVFIGSSIDRFENRVEVQGAVFRPGVYELGKEINSVKSLVTHADGLTEDAFASRAVLTRMKADRTLETLPVDLAGILSGTVADVPLRNEDVLVISSQTELVNSRTLTIQGEVQSPGDYPFAANTTIEDLIVLAGGLTDAASMAKVDVSRRIRDPKALKSGREISRYYTFDLKDGLVIEEGRGFVLEPFDIVQVRRSPGYMEPRNITVEGEVVFEGEYTLATKNQRLSDAVKAAGGVTEEAYVKGARLLRRMNKDERARMQSVLDMARQTAGEKDSIRLDSLQLQDVYSVGIQLEKAIENPGSQYDIVLRDGDRLVVPEYNNTVKISGDVLYPNTVAFNDAKSSYKWYIDLAGGFTDKAKKRKSYIVYQNGMVARASKGKVEPGCEIIVPAKPQRDNASLMQWISIGTSMASLATMFVSLANLIK